MKKKRELELLQTSIPRELCKECYDWCSQEEVGFNDIPHCLNADSCCRDYLNHLREDCPKYIKQ